jgi:hypothetical protein
VAALVMSEWSSRPRTLPPTGRRKATHTWCPTCERLHATPRAVGGEEICPTIAAQRQDRRERLFAGPRIQQPPAVASRVVLTGSQSGGGS